MRLAVFGATGRLGREVVRVALSEGHTVRAMVRAMVRDPDRQAIDGVEVVPGHLGDADAIAATVEGAEAVISCVGVVRGGDPEVFGVGMQHLIGAMEANGVRRLVAISGAGLELEGDVTGIGRRLIVTLLELFARDVLRGKELEWEQIRASTTDWTLVRVARMVERPPKGDVKVDARQVSGSPMVAYADVAAWMVHELSARRWVREAPFVSGA